VITTDDGRITCDCCGAPAATFIARKNGRCWSHQKRNPCAIEGCTHTTDAAGDPWRNDLWLCGVHWRRYAPPRGRIRRAYLKIFRQVKRHGWDAVDRRGRTLNDRYWLFWFQLVRRARVIHQGGRVDMAEIYRLFPELKN
jgi:hypothetical protein